MIQSPGLSPSTGSATRQDPRGAAPTPGGRQLDPSQGRARPGHSAGCSTWHRLGAGGPGAPSLTAFERAFPIRCHAGLMAGGMSRGHSPTLAERSAVGTAGEVGADPELAALRDRPRPVLTDGSPACRTALVAGPGCLPSGVRTPRQVAGRAAWCTPSTTVRRRSSSRRGCPPTTCSRPVSRPHPHGVCGGLPRSGGGGGELVDAGLELGSALAVRLVCSCARSASPSRRSGVGAFAQLVGVGCPLRSWRPSWCRSAGGPGPGSTPGPGPGFRQCRPGRRERSRCRRCSGQGSCGRPW